MTSQAEPPFTLFSESHLPPARRRYAEVAFPLGLPHPLTYIVPDEFRDRVAPGMRVLAPLQKRIQTGYVVRVLEEASLPENTQLRRLHDMPDDEPLFSRSVFELCAWMADYYCCTLGEALHAAAPPGARFRAIRRFALNPDALTSARFSENQKKVVTFLYQKGIADEHELRRILGSANTPAVLHALLRRSVIREVQTDIERSISEQSELFVCLREDHMLDENELLALQKKAPRQAAVYLDLIHDEPERMAPILYEKHGIDISVLRALERKGLVTLEYRETYRIPSFDVDDRSRAKPTLNEEQRMAWDDITSAVEKGTFKTYLLKGVTGSGKTEVYLQAVEHTLARGKNAIILVPEISLTPQTVARFKARFDADIAVLHSGLSAGERYDEWRRARRDEVRIVVGARSAIFAPLENVGIIVVDEEHDLSYKQADPAPRYHARDVAIMRAKLSRAVCVLGSATPSLESYHNSLLGKFGLITLSRRATAAEMPRVEIIDMRTESKNANTAPFFSKPLENAMRERVEKGEQVLLLLNRRGFSPFVLCPLCGWNATCADCHVSLTYHAKGGILLCHYCNTRVEVPQQCGDCGFHPLLYLGTGTQKVEDTLRQMFPESRIERMDADTTSGKSGHARILGRLAAREIDILIGTQMIAKGHDYPNVTLVGVLNADSGLNFPDFRAAEQTFQLLTQVGGRSGRGELPGEVIIQTYRPHHYAILCAASHDYEAFYSREIQDRRAVGYPPFRRMANIMIESEDAQRAEYAAICARRHAREIREQESFTDVSILGPAPGIVPRVRRKYRWNLGLLCANARRLNLLTRATMEALSEQEKKNLVDIKVDLDPYGTL